MARSLTHRVTGLSPLARGKRREFFKNDPAKGPIPAGAGETTCWCSRPNESGAYPRWRGGNFPCRALCPLAQGLSPLARGKQIDSGKSMSTRGPIPAGAGETW